MTSCRSNLLMGGMGQPDDILAKSISWKHLKGVFRVFSVPVVYKAFYLSKGKDSHDYLS